MEQNSITCGTLASSILMTPLYYSVSITITSRLISKKIDPEYGTMTEYLSLVKEIHKRNMKIYQDVEMQYVTQDHAWYKDSFNNPKSKYSKYMCTTSTALNQKPFFFYNVPEFTPVWRV